MHIERTYTHEVTQRTVKGWHTRAVKTGTVNIVWARDLPDRELVVATPHLLWVVCAKCLVLVEQVVELQPYPPNLWIGSYVETHLEHDALIEELELAGVQSNRIVALPVSIKTAIDIDPIFDWLIVEDMRAPHSENPSSAPTESTDFYRADADRKGIPMYLLLPSRRRAPEGWQQLPRMRARIPQD